MSSCSHLAATQDLLAQICAHHTTVIAWWSGGKDSTALVHLLRPWRTQVHLVANVMVRGFEGLQAYMETQAAAWGFPSLTFTPPLLTFAEYVARFGWPTTLVPDALAGLMPDPYYAGGPTVASLWHCKTLLRLIPLAETTQALGADAVLMGSRASDAPQFARVGPLRDGAPWLGWMRYDPLHFWTTDEVYAYLDAHEIQLPVWEQAKREVDWVFPDIVHYPYHPPYMRWLQQHRPDDFAYVWEGFAPALRQVLAQARTYVETWEPFVREMEEAAVDGAGPTLAQLQAQAQAELASWEGVRRG